MQTGIGSCRDSAWLLVSILRELGLAARFVSGYLVQLSSDIEALDGPSGPAADFTDLHAWTEVYIPGAGWIGLDPTSGLFAGEGHIPLAATPHPSSAAPITGSTGVAEATLDFANIVTRVHEDPRVTLPYTDAAWAAINALGTRIDQRLADADVRLTIGGEPTFVSVDNQVDEEWITAADGPHKRERASVLAARLKALWAPGGLVQRNQGKWYPGEPLPRWQIGIHWRRDGQPLWNDPALLADPWGAEYVEVEPEAAQQVLSAIADGLGLPATQVRPAYEDALSRLAEAVRLPVRRSGRTRRGSGNRHPGCPRGPAGPSGGVGGRPGRLPAARCIAATTTPAGPVPTGGCAAAASCCSTVTRRPGCGCRWARSAGSRRARRCPPTRSPAGGGRCRWIARATTRPWRRPTTHPPPRWSPRSGTACSTSSCRPPRSWNTSST